MDAWRRQYSPILWQPVHAEAVVWKWSVPHPNEAGFFPSLGEAAGQKADFRLPLDDGREIHVREYDLHYTIHWYQVSAIKNPIGHLLSDAPHWILLGLAGVFLAILVLWPIQDSTED